MRAHAGADFGSDEPFAHRLPARQFLWKREWYVSEIFIEGLDLESMPGHVVVRVCDQRANHRIGRVECIDSRDHSRLESREGVKHCRNEHIAGQTAGEIEVQIQHRPIWDILGEDYVKAIPEFMPEFLKPGRNSPRRRSPRTAVRER